MAERVLQDRVVLLTGASSGFGPQLAKALDEAGARVVLAARRLDRLKEVGARLSGARAISCDVTFEDDRRKLVETAIELFGRIDGLVNNAGVSLVTRAMVETVEEFNRVIQTNLVAPFALAQLAAEQMKEQGGAIVNVASIAGFRSTAALPAAGYTASKSGLIGLTRELATQWARYGIRVNCLAPGFFETEMTAALFSARSEGPEWLTSGTPLGRAGRPQELNGALVYLLACASSYVTGQTLVVDGGLTAR